MPYELPPQLTGDLRKDVQILWDAVFRLTETLRLEEMNRISRNKEGKP